MENPPHIETKNRLSQFSQISTLICHVLSVAQAGGLAEKKAKSMYGQILDAYATLDGEAFWLFKDELIRLLVTPDADFADGSKTANWQSPGRN